VLLYLRRYAEVHDLLRLVSFDTAVIDVRPCEANGNGRAWAVTTRQGGAETETTYDAVVVCNGHYSAPSVPEIRGMDAFPGECMHSHNYRRPEAFAGKRVLLMGVRCLLGCAACCHSCPRVADMLTH